MLRGDTLFWSARASVSKAMEALALRYPDDDEAQIGYAITQLKRAAILEPIFKRQPRHPGVWRHQGGRGAFMSSGASAAGARSRRASRF